MSLVVRTLSDRVFEIVREQIVTGQLADNAPIRQDALAAELGISKIPLREALARLEQDGLIVSHANRGYFVQPLSAEQLDEIFELRLSIEPAAAAHAALAATDAERSAAIDAFERLDSAAGINLAEVAVRNREFHIALTNSPDRPLTMQLVQRLSIMAERYVVAHLEPAGRETRAHQEHRGLLDAFLARDAAKLQALLAQHIRSTLDDLNGEPGAIQGKGVDVRQAQISK
ncbi:GntR family transcriptional regulator [Sandaracinobacter neustonicus]|uniref:GntR family transcriptional regulator n=1 Tax=Sandaracinobacter neustonicus TaxID=1715348 RepID=A0A501XWD9_9SPHN|nr:GntR family transcriptional regulator [Sandaracinobacter neustonicus]TPE64779.1 GntR family transcriptional regulator [Sandaracinobacter neustonicus]